MSSVMRRTNLYFRFVSMFSMLLLDNTGISSKYFSNFYKLMTYQFVARSYYSAFFKWVRFDFDTIHCHVVCSDNSS